MHIMYILYHIFPIKVYVQLYFLVSFKCIQPLYGEYDMKVGGQMQCTDQNQMECGSCDCEVITISPLVCRYCSFVQSLLFIHLIFPLWNILFPKLTNQAGIKMEYIIQANINVI